MSPSNKLCHQKTFKSGRLKVRELTLELLGMGFRGNENMKGQAN